MTEVIRISGEAGDGIITLGEVFSKALVRSGYEVFTFRTYPAEVRGGLTMFQVRFDAKPVYTQGDEVDLLLVFNKDAYNNEISALKKGGVLLFDSDSLEPDIKGIGLPFTSISRDLSKNMVALGALVSIYSLDKKIVERVLRDRFGAKQAILEIDTKSLSKGFDLSTKTLSGLSPRILPEKAPKEKLLVSGNEAICLGALAAGLKFFAGYPITPASEILEFLALHLPEFDGITVQTEDEHAALGAVIGASYAGQKAMTATSGPGFSVMSELIGYASMAEIPVVIVDCQRGGPSTGLPTKTEQSDLTQSIFGSHGEGPRVVLAPFNVEDCYYQMIKAFNIAEECQLPVIVLVDLSISHRLESVNRFKTDDLDVRTRSMGKETRDVLFERYMFTPDGISPTLIPGKSDTLFISTGVEHDSFGRPNYDPVNRKKIVEKRFKKFEKALNYSEIVTHGNPDSRIRLVSWGSTEGAVREAVSKAMEMGIDVASIHPRMLYPTPKQELSKLLESAERIIVPEVNFTGQFAMLLRSGLKLDLDTLNKYEGLPFKPAEILRKIQEVADGL